MNKPVWIRFFGWAFWFCVGVFVTLVLLHGFAGFSAAYSAAGIVVLLAGGPCLFMWIVGSIVFAFQKKGAKLRAQAYADRLKQAYQSQGLCGYQGPEGIRCDLAAGHSGPHRGVKRGPQAVPTGPLGLTGSDKQ